MNIRKTLSINLADSSEKAHEDFIEDFFNISKSNFNHMNYLERGFFKQINETDLQYKKRLDEFPLIVSGFSSISWVETLRLTMMTEDGSLKIFMESQPLLKEYLQDNYGFEAILWEQVMGVNRNKEKNQRFLDSILEIHPDFDINSHYLYLGESLNDKTEPFNGKPLKSETALHAAFYYSDVNIIELLVENGATLEGNKGSPPICLGYLPNTEALENLYKYTSFNYLELLEQKFNKEQSYAPFFEARKNMIDSCSDNLTLLQAKINFIHKKEQLDSNIDWVSNTVLSLNFIEKIKTQKETSELRLSFLTHTLENNKNLYFNHIEDGKTLGEHIKDINHPPLVKIINEININKSLKNIKAKTKLKRF